MLDEGKTDVFLLLIEAVKTPEKFKRVAEKALKAGKPLIVRKIGQSAPGSRAVASHTAALAGSQAAYRAMFERYGVDRGRRFRGDARYRRQASSPAATACRPAIASASAPPQAARGVWMADACAAAGLEVPVLDDATRATIDVHLPSYATSQNPVDSTAQGVQKLGYAKFARLVAHSPSVDGVVVVITARRSAFLEADLPKLKDLARESRKPVFMWTYTLPSARTRRDPQRGGLSAVHQRAGCARTLRAMADYRILRERLLRPIEIVPAGREAHADVQAMLAEPAPMLCEYRARPLLAAYGIGADNRESLSTPLARRRPPRRRSDGPWRSRFNPPDIPHKTEAGAVALDLAGADTIRAAYERVLAAARQHAPTARIDGVLVQPMAPPGREVILGVNRDPTWGPLLMVGLGGVLVEAFGDVALAPVPLDHAAARALIGAPEGRADARSLSRAAAGGHRGARRPHGAAVAVRRRSWRRRSPKSISTPSSSIRAARACRSWTR